MPLPAARSGFLDRVHERSLLEAAAEADGIVVVDRLPGSSVIAGTAIGRVWRRDGTPFPADEQERILHKAAQAVSTARERTDRQDIAFPCASSPTSPSGRCRPASTTRRPRCTPCRTPRPCCATSRAAPLGPRLLYDDDHRLRAVLHRPRLSDLLDLAVHQPLRYGGAEPEVLARLLRLLQELAWIVAPEHHPLLDGYHREIRTVIARHEFPATERRRLDELGDELARMITPA